MRARAGKRYLGIDVGTSQVRVCAIDDQRETVAFASAALPPATRVDGRIEQDPDVWWDATCHALDRVLAEVAPSTVRALAVDGTSGTLLLADQVGAPVGPALMYNDQSSLRQAERVARVAPVDSPARGAGSALARMLALLERWGDDRGARATASPRDMASTARTCDIVRPCHALHQADWIAARLSGRLGTSDANNALKLGYDPVTGQWPAWLSSLGFDVGILPRVVAPGTPLHAVSADAAARFGLAKDTLVVAGTTDSVAAAIATGIEHVGDAMTSLGSTLVLKVVSHRPVLSAIHGVYTHRVGGRWLAGGASNSGGAVLKSFFPVPEIERLSRRIDPMTPSPLDYYPLIGPGERFPINDPSLPPRLSPRPSDDVAFLHGLLESMARIERDGYRLLESLGAPVPRSVRTAGGGAVNEAWRRIRERVLGVPVTRASTTEAAYGTALLALAGARA
jgi:sugar (pentulose or hexulose) kinase